MRCASYRSAHARNPASPAKKKKPCRAERRPRCRRVGRRQRSCRRLLDCSLPKRSARLNRSVRETAVMVTTRSTLILKSRGRRSHRVICLWPLAPNRGQSWPRWQPSCRGRGLYRLARPGAAADGDGAKHSERLPPPVRGSTDV